jgi:LacI family transcriptional regulator
MDPPVGGISAAMTSGREPRARREDVARLAGTSVAVVSYVVNNGPRPVATETRERVLAAIEKINYRPNGIAKALAAGTTRTKGMGVPEISNPFFSAMAHALEDIIFESGRVLLLGDSAESPEREKEILDSFLQRHVEGLLYVGIDDHTRIGGIVRSGTPVVVLDRVSPDSPAASVVVDNVGGARDATQHLIGHGHTQIGFLGGPADLSTAHDRQDGWALAMDTAGLEVRPEWCFAAPFAKRAGLEIGRQLFALATIPHAIFAASDQQAIGLLRAASEAGVRVPDDLAVFTFDGSPDSEFSIPPLSTVRQPIEEIARAAVGLLSDPTRYDSMHVTCDYELLIRRSCGCG